MADSSFTSADEFRTNTPYHQIETLEMGSGGILIHSYLPPVSEGPLPPWDAHLGQALGERS